MFYVTIASNHPKGAGYYEIHEDDYGIARSLCFKHLNDKWCFMYDSLDDIHALDRTKHGELHHEEMK